MAVKRKSRKRAAATSKRAVAKTAKQIRSVAKAAKKSRTTRKLPKLKILSRQKPGSSKKKHAKKLPRPLFRRHIIHGEGGDLIRVMEPIGYRDYQDKFRRLISSPKYLALKREFPQLTYSIFGHPGNHKAPTLEALIAFFETAYEPTLRAMNMSRAKRNDFFAHLVIYGVKRSYRVAPPLRNAHGKRKKNRRGI